MGKGSIRGRLQLLLFLAGLLSFMVLAVASVWSIYNLHGDAVNNGRYLGISAIEDTERITLHLAEQQLMIISREKASNVDRELRTIKEDVEYIAKMMELVAAGGRSEFKKGLKNPGIEPVKGGETYLYCAPSIRTPEAMAEIADEMASTSHIADIMETMAGFYDKDQCSIFVASKSGYMYCVDLIRPEQEYVDFTGEFMGTYVPQERPWFKAAMEAGKPTVTDVYMGYDGEAVVDYVSPYYFNGEFAGVAGLELSLSSLYQEVSEKSFGSETINFVLNHKGLVVASSETEGVLAASESQVDLRESSERDLAEASRLMVEGNSGIARVAVGGEEFLLAYTPLESAGWSFGTMARVDEVMAPVKTARDEMEAHEKEAAQSLESFLKKAILEILIIMAVFTAGLVFVSRKASEHFVAPILLLKEGVGKITKGRLEEKIDIRTGDEIEELSDSVNNMTEELKRYMENISEAAAKREAISTEMKLARGIKSAMLPKAFPRGRESEGFELYASVISAREAGGDFYDFYLLDDSHLAVTMAHVGNYGVPASLFMMISKTVLKSEVLAAAAAGVDSINWGQVIERVNRQLCEDNGGETMFAAVFFAVLNRKTGELSYVDAGGKAPLLGHVNEGHMDWKYMEVAQKGSAMGIMDNAEYSEGQMLLLPGDMVCFCTDGVFRSVGMKGGAYTEEMLRQDICREGQPENTVKTVVDKVLAGVERYREGADQVGDFSMMGLRYLGLLKNN